MGKIAVRLELPDLVERHVAPGTHLGIGGLHFHNTPMAIVREIVRQAVPLGLLTPPIDGSLNADQLIGAGLVEEVQIAYLGMEMFGLARRYRVAAEAGRVRTRDMEEAGFAFAVASGAAGQPFAALPHGFLPTDESIPTILSVNPVDYRVVENPFTGRRHALVRAITPDVTLLHCQLIDRHGNCGFLGAPFLDVEMAKAGRVCVVQAERQVDELPSSCRAVLPGYAVDAYCVLEGGAHPASSHGMYWYDVDAIQAYVAASRTDEGFAQYRTEVIAPSEDDYRRVANVTERVRELSRDLP